MSVLRLMYCGSFATKNSMVVFFFGFDPTIAQCQVKFQNSTLNLQFVSILSSSVPVFPRCHLFSLTTTRSIKNFIKSGIITFTSLTMTQPKVKLWVSNFVFYIPVGIWIYFLICIFGGKINKIVLE